VWMKGDMICLLNQIKSSRNNKQQTNKQTNSNFADSVAHSLLPLLEIAQASRDAHAHEFTSTPPRTKEDTRKNALSLLPFAQALTRAVIVSSCSNSSRSCRSLHNTDVTTESFRLT